MDNHPLIAAAALKAILEDDPDRAERLLLSLPRSYRGKLRMACDDLDLQLSRLGTAHG